MICPKLPGFVPLVQTVDGGAIYGES